MKKNLLFKLLAVCLLLLTLCTPLIACGAAKSTGGASYDDYNSNAFPEAEEKYPEKEEDIFLNSSTTTSTPAISDRKIIKTFNISSETKDYDAAVTALNTLIAEYGGYIESASASNKSLNNASDHYTRYASYTVRIPAENAETFVGSIGSLLNITSNRSYIEDVSENYYSIEARLEELQVERDSLLDILEQADTKADYDLWTTVHARLSEVTQQIAVYQGQLNRYDSKIAYSTVNLEIREVITYSEVSRDNSFGSRLGAAFKDGWGDFVVGVQDFIIWFAGALPVLLLLAVIASVITVIILVACRKKK